MDDYFAPALAAIASGEVEQLADAIDRDPTLAGRRSSCGHPTLLQLVACEHDIPNATEIALMLVSAGSRMDGPLIAAAGCGNEPVLRALLDNGASIAPNPSWTALDEALYWNKKEIAALLLDRGAMPTSLRAAASLGDAKRLQSFFVGPSLASDAGPVRSPFPDTVPESLAWDEDRIVNNAFVSAVNSEQIPAAAFLLEQGANVNALPPGFHWRGTALHAAAWRGSWKTDRWLLANGADKSIKDGLVNSDAVGWAKHHGHNQLADLIQSA